MNGRITKQNAYTKCTTQNVFVFYLLILFLFFYICTSKIFISFLKHSHCLVLGVVGANLQANVSETANIFRYCREPLNMFTIFVTSNSGETSLACSSGKFKLLNEILSHSYVVKQLPHRFALTIHTHNDRHSFTPPLSPMTGPIPRNFQPDVN